jgi:hypothetical protein
MLALIAFALIASSPAPPSAEPPGDAERPPSAIDAEESAAATEAEAIELSLQAAVASVQRTHRNAKILSAETLEGHRTASKVYRIKFLTADGRVRVVQVPAQRTPPQRSR